MESITFLPCADLEAVNKYYVEKLGLSLRLDQGSCQIFRVDGCAHIGFCIGLSSLAPADSVILTLVREDVDEFYEALISNGVGCDGSPRLNEKFQIYHFFAVDPTGYRIEVQRFTDPRW